jgi:ABC-type transport system involved in cytochrome bd biosynthesis fused ATPase/permease subunit
MAALDQANAEVVFQALAGLARRGALVLMCTHDPAVLGRCDRVWELPGRGAASGASVEAYDRADGGADGVPETVPEAGLEAAS